MKPRLCTCMTKTPEHHYHAEDCAYRLDMEKIMAHAPIEKEVVHLMNATANTVADHIPEGWGFAMLTYKLGEGYGHRMNYICTSEREDMATALKELLDSFAKDGILPRKTGE